MYETMRRAIIIRFDASLGMPLMQSRQNKTEPQMIHAKLNTGGGLARKTVVRGPGRETNGLIGMGGKPDGRENR